MCGICGIVSTKPIEGSLIKRMTALLEHRGPDDEGTYLTQDAQHTTHIALGHRRLSIIDLSPAGHQPMANEDKTIWLVYNGELYNFRELRTDLEKQGHKFRSQSDAEVIIHAYEQFGPDCVKKFNGIFALAIWDARKSRLFLARDHLGIKPLYYTKNAGFFAFASEIKALLEIPELKRSMDPASLDSFLTYRFVPSPKTMFKDIYKLPPAHYLLFEKNQVKTGCYWDYVPKISRKKESDLVAELADKFYATVKRQMVSAVPIGALLSGGVDSAAVVAVMSELSSQPVKTFTVGFEGAGDVNELKEARETAEIFKTEHHEQVISQKDYQSWLPRSIWNLEEPVGTTSALALYYICEVVKGNVKVVLTGQGADEPFAGYDRYKGEKYAAWYQAIPAALRKYIIKPIAETLPRSEKLKRAVRSLGTTDALERFIRIYAVFDQSMKASLYQPGIQKKLAGQDPAAMIKPIYDRVTHLSPLGRMLYLDTRVWLPDDLLLVGDKMSMAHAVEARVPYLDVELIEFIETIPVEYKLKGLTGKYIHKKAVSKWLPKKIINRQKKGFPTPMEQWLKTPAFLKYVRELFSESVLFKEYFQKSFVDEMIKKHQTGQETYTRQLFLLLSLELWHKIFIEKTLKI